MRGRGTREVNSMATKEVTLDRAQVKKAVQALQAFLKSKATGESLFLNESQPVSLLFTLWKIPKLAQTIRIPLPHGQRTDSEEICLFTRDEPKMTSEQTQRFYKKLLEERGVKNITEVIPYKVLKTEYKPFEAKRRLLGNFDMFLSDDRIRRLLPSHIGKHFYEGKKEPLSVNLQSKQLAKEIQRVIQGTFIKVTNRGCCCMARVGHSGMTADEVTENIEAAVKTIAAKIRMNGPVVKLIHLKSETSVALPIYTSDLSHLSEAPPPAEREKTAEEKTGKIKETKKKQDFTVPEMKDEDEEEEIPQLVPIETPRKKPKLEKPSKPKKMSKPSAAKKAKAQSKATKKPPKESKVKRKKVKV